MNAKHDAFRWLEDQQRRIVADLIELANLNSGSNNVAGLNRVADWLGAWLDVPAAFQRIALPPRQEFDDAGQMVTLPTGPALRWDCRPNAARRILLAIHYDTVFDSQHPFQACSRESENRLRGPGVADAKGGILVLCSALRAVEQFGLAQECGWTILLNPDEEIGSPHSAKLLSEVAREFDFGLLFEPAYPTGELVSKRKGSGNYTLVVRGVAAHAGRHFADGRNAVAKLCGLMSELDAWNAQHAGCSINVGFIKGGGPVNIVPDLAVGKFNVRVDEATDAAWFQKSLQQRLDALNCSDGFQCECLGKVTSPPKLVTPAMQSVMEAVERAHADVGLAPIDWVSTGGVCDGNKLAAAGLPNVDTLGPVGGGLHSDQEWVRTTSIVEKAKVVVSLIHRYTVGE